MPAVPQSSSAPVTQHFVPKVYLKNFCDAAGRLQMFDKKRARFHQNVSPANVATYDHLYTIETAEGTDFTIERKLLGKVESDYGIAINSLKHEAPGSNAQGNLSTILRFLSYLHARNPEQLDLFSALSRDVIDVSGEQLGRHRVNAQGNNHYLPHIQGEAHPMTVQLNTMRAMRARAERVYNMLMCAGPWVYYLAHKGSVFVTSDNPYRINNLGWIPLSSSVLIAARSTYNPDQTMSGIRQATADMVADINSWQASGATRFVFAAHTKTLERVC